MPKDMDPFNTPNRNPPWNRDELILALDLYFTLNGTLPRKDDPYIIELSALLIRVARLTKQRVNHNFRNTNGVSMKLANFQRLDPAHRDKGRIGLSRGGQEEEVVWKEFSSDRAHLRQVATSIRAAVESGEDITPVDEDDFCEADEGRILTRIHRLRERNRKLVEQRKAQALRLNGNLRCEVCGFDFSAQYGTHGDGFIEAHHIKPLHLIEPGTKTKLSDLALLCANCHRMIHARRPWLSLDELRQIITPR